MLFLLISVSLISVSIVAASDVTDDIIGIENVDQSTAADMVIGEVEEDNTYFDADLNRTMYEWDIKDFKRTPRDERGPWTFVEVPDDEADNDGADAVNKTIDGVISAPGSIESNSSKNSSETRPYQMIILEKCIGPYTSEVRLVHDFAFDHRYDSYLKGGIVLNHSIVIEGNGHTLDGQGYSRFFNIVKDDIDVVIKNINFINGWAYDECGGAILGNCKVINCTFKNNTIGFSGRGGAMYGGFAINCLFEDNNEYCPDAHESVAGAMYGGTAIGCIFRNNFAGNGGAVCNCTVEDSLFEGNNAQENGGAAYNSTVKNSHFRLNIAKNNGGAACNCTVENSHFKANKVEYVGGAVYGGIAKNSTFIRNEAGLGGAMSRGYAEDSTFVENRVHGAAAMLESSAVRCVFINNTPLAPNSVSILDSNVTDCTLNNDTVYTYE